MKLIPTYYVQYARNVRSKPTPVFIFRPTYDHPKSHTFSTLIVYGVVIISPSLNFVNPFDTHARHGMDELDVYTWQGCDFVTDRS